MRERKKFVPDFKNDHFDLDTWNEFGRNAAISFYKVL